MKVKTIKYYVDLFVDKYYEQISSRWYKKSGVLLTKEETREAVYATVTHILNNLRYRVAQGYSIFIKGLFGIYQKRNKRWKQ